MKKITICISTLLISLGMTAATASSSLANHYSSHVYKGIKASVNAAFHPYTDISIINASNTNIYMVVPNSPVDQMIAPGFNGHITNYDTSINSTYVMLLDPYRYTIFGKLVCREAIITVRGSLSGYKFNEDEELCY